LNEAGIPNKSLEKKTTYEVLAATRCYLESEWQSLDRAYYNQGEFQVKERFRKYLLKKSDKLPGYDIPTANDQISEQIKLRKGTFLKKVYLCKSLIYIFRGHFKSQGIWSSSKCSNHCTDKSRYAVI